MAHDLQMRLLAALIIGVGLGALLTQRLRVRLDNWKANPAAAQAEALQRLERSASGRAMVSLGIVCMLLTLLVEIMVSLAGGAS